ncbi:hypothetical protein KP509_13G080100 [Ceratopteris richardii]|uniref:Uncharacterized protein n=1 Tax=Ceratopteris richardii TaxID=49495 RepID=A0A8T2THD3_CERRI|nr:hypothetical protein KP509_13G080100 [Ceratopteris richardii]
MAVAIFPLLAPAIASIIKTRTRCLSVLSKSYFSSTSSILCHARSPSSSSSVPVSSSSSVSANARGINHLELEQTQVRVNGRELAVVQPRDIDAVLDMYIKQGKLDGDPYWCRIWPSAIVLAEEVMKNPQLVANLDVCDLGSGLGLAGVSALLAGAKQVVFYDQEPLALFCSLLTVHLNIAHASTNLSYLLEHVFVDCTSDYLESLAYGLSLSPQVFGLGGIQAKSNPMAKAVVYDWSKKQTNGLYFSTVLACDILYEKASVAQIAGLLPCLLQSGSGKVLMTDPTHRTPQNREQLLDLIKSDSDSKGLALERMDSIKQELNNKIEEVVLMQFHLN